MQPQVSAFHSMARRAFGLGQCESDCDIPAAIFEAAGWNSDLANLAFVLSCHQSDSKNSSFEVQ